ncbi:MAG: tetratricopeptide repeat protein [Elusimicrobiota bacterium]|nr:tetratricopeptide repeat protein [Elusimicrobiota bacterium]
MEKTAEEKAAIRYITTAKSKKEKIDFYISKGDERLLRGEYSYAIDYYNEAKTLKKKNPNVLLRLGESYRLADMEDEAIDSYNKALKYGSNDIRIFLGLGIVYKSKYLYEQAEEFYRKASELEKNNTMALTGLADIYSEQGKYPQAIELYEKVLTISPTDEVKLKLTMLNILVGYDEGVKQYNTALDASKILNGYINLKKNPDNAISDFIFADEYFLRAVAYLKKNDLSNAKKSLDILINRKEESLSKKLSIALIKHIQ